MAYIALMYVLRPLDLVPLTDSTLWMMRWAAESAADVQSAYTYTTYEQQCWELTDHVAEGGSELLQLQQRNNRRSTVSTLERQLTSWQFPHQLHTLAPA